MNKNLLCAVITLLAGALAAADANPQSEVQAAIKKLSDQPNYSWTSTTAGGGARGGGGGGGGGGSVSGKISKDGLMTLSLPRRDSTLEAVVKGGKAAVKMPDGWKSPEEVGSADGGQPNRGRGLARQLENAKSPAAEAEMLAGKARDLKQADGAYAGTLDAEAVTGLMAPGGRRPNAGGPGLSNSKGTVKFWVKDGVLSKYEYNVKGTATVGGNEREIDRTTTVEIKDVGTTKIDVPEEAKKKIS